jgi:hypothetical protein
MRTPITGLFCALGAGLALAGCPGDPPVTPKPCPETRCPAGQLCDDGECRLPRPCSSAGCVEHQRCEAASGRDARCLEDARGWVQRRRLCGAAAHLPARPAGQRPEESRTPPRLRRGDAGAAAARLPARQRGARPDSSVCRPPKRCADLAARRRGLPRDPGRRRRLHSECKDAEATRGRQPGGECVLPRCDGRERPAPTWTGSAARAAASANRGGYYCRGRADRRDALRPDADGWVRFSRAPPSRERGGAGGRAATCGRSAGRPAQRGGQAKRCRCPSRRALRERPQRRPAIIDGTLPTGARERIPRCPRPGPPRRELNGLTNRA